MGADVGGQLGTLAEGQPWGHPGRGSDEVSGSSGQVNMEIWPGIPLAPDCSSP